MRKHAVSRAIKKFGEGAAQLALYGTVNEVKPVLASVVEQDIVAGDYRSRSS